jgi:hypothetical protein
MKEKHMQLITAFELERRDDDNLRKLFTDVSGVLARTEPETVERATALASLENISQALAQRFC